MNPPLQKIAGAALIFISIAGISKVFHDFFTYKTLPSEEKLIHLWKKDLLTLKEHKKIPKFWNQIRNIEMIPGDNTSRIWLEKIKPPISTNKNGKVNLEILVLSWKDEDDGSFGAIIQYDAIDIKTHNLIWELGRTYHFSAKKEKAEG